MGYYARVIVSAESTSVKKNWRGKLCSLVEIAQSQVHQAEAHPVGSQSCATELQDVMVVLQQSPAKLAWLRKKAILGANPAEEYLESLFPYVCHKSLIMGNLWQTDLSGFGTFSRLLNEAVNGADTSSSRLRVARRRSRGGQLR
jgi:hypothetical protein